MPSPAEPLAVVVVDIPADSELIRDSTFPFSSSSAATATIHHHPLTEIASSPGHLLLLKLWQRDEDLASLRAVAVESRLSAAKRDAFWLSAFFLAFHILSLTLLFSSSSASAASCKNWFVFSALSAITSVVIVSCVQGAVCECWRAEGELQREKTAARAVVKCMQELRMKGASFDLSKEPQVVRRAKSSSVEVRWRRPLRWVCRNLLTLCLLCVAGLLAAAAKFVVCG